MPRHFITVLALHASGLWLINPVDVPRKWKVRVAVCHVAYAHGCLPSDVATAFGVRSGRDWLWRPAVDRAHASLIVTTPYATNHAALASYAQAITTPRVHFQARGYLGRGDA
jgi:hypothetical protein